MSTRSTRWYGKNFHFFFDYADNNLHLELNGEEVSCPDDFLEGLNELTRMKDTLERLMDAPRRVDSFSKQENG